ncbi:DNA-processing protein DprA [Thiohalomonas denitrificans]|uniref:DNA-processing protein DprA n=1 Tax=Thiohalomonas denitrificans TaxID=415747 RepID=UPI001C317FCE|nr:DNA-processing protein DprA [Thiohalomonas denitrificans]
MHATDDKEELHYRLALLHAPGVGPVTFSDLLGRYGSAVAVFREGREQGALGTYLRGPDWVAVERDLAWSEEPGCRLLLQGEPEYPEQLAVVADAPPVLFVRGDAALLSGPQLSMVGSRNPTPLGAETAREFAHHLAGVGLTVTSGLALGIDAAAHRGALSAEGSTVAVFGTGLDRVYPARHRELAHAIVEAGSTLVSEFPPGTAPLPGHFPRRNRIISGLSLGTLVVEAAPRSGSLITARQANEQGREVFAVPGSIHNPLARGCHQLIRDGAKLVETAQDILEELAPQLEAIVNTPPASREADKASRESVPELDKEQLELLVCLDHSPTSVDRLVERSGLTPDAVSSMLLLLELQGYVVSVAGGYARTVKRE